MRQRKCPIVELYCEVKLFWKTIKARPALPNRFHSDFKLNKNKVKLFPYFSNLFFNPEFIFSIKKI